MQSRAATLSGTTPPPAGPYPDGARPKRHDKRIEDRHRPGEPPASGLRWLSAGLEIESAAPGENTPRPGLYPGSQGDLPVGAQQASFGWLRSNLPWRRSFCPAVLARTAPRPEPAHVASFLCA